MNKVIHFEIPAKNYQRAKSFYSQLFGWDISEWPGSPEAYGMARTMPADDKGFPTETNGINGAIYQAKEGSPTTTVITINVDSIDDHLAKIIAGGGVLVQPKTSIGDMGFTATFTDPEGNLVGLWQTVQK